MDVVSVPFAEPVSGRSDVQDVLFIVLVVVVH